MNKYDTYMWIRRVITSCTKLHQWTKCIRLIQRYEKTFPKEKKLSKALRTYHNISLQKLK